MGRKLTTIIFVILASTIACLDAVSDDNAADPVTGEARVSAASDGATETAESPAIVYTVREYDPRRNPFDDLEATLSEAQKANHRVLIQVGGNWCGWCHILERMFRQNERVAAALQGRFLIMKLNVSQENPNQEFLSQLPQFAAFPHLFVLDTDGTLLHSQDPTPFERGRGYSERLLLNFLQIWAPAGS